MISLLAQFVEEGVELLDVVESGLLTLERDPHDPQALNEVFRAAHTFKGSSGLFDLPALTRLTHACEDLLDAARAGERTLTPEVIEGLHRAFDLVRIWLRVLDETDEERLPADATERANVVIAALRGLPAETVAGSASAEPAVASAPSAPSAASSPELWEVVYTPDRDCFFRGEDPLLVVSQVPELVAFGVVDPLDGAARADGDGPAGAAEDVDDFACRLTFVVRSAASRSDLEHLFRFVADEVTITLVEPADAAASAAAEALDPMIAGLLESQRALLTADGDADGVDGRVISAATVIGRVFASEGWATGPVDAALEAWRATGRADALLAVIDAALRPAGAPEQPAAHRHAGDLRAAESPKDDRPPAPAAAAAPNGAAAAASAVPSANAEDGQRGSSRTLRVDQAKVDRLLELAGELVVAKNALPFLARSAEEHGADAVARQLRDQYAVTNRLAEDLQQAVMDLRMLPVSVALARFPRLVRDLARKLGKEVRLVVDGEDARSEKDVLDAIGDPLLHLVRNSLDHGIETPDERRASGKPSEATLRLVAEQEADAVVIRVNDDGRGIDPAKVRAKAVDRGLLSDEEAAILSDRDTLRLVFEPGFSTADTISDISGRGVGMDAVRATISRLGGSVSLDSTPGVGTEITIRLPLTMSVMSVMTISAGGQRFGVPLELVRETRKLPRTSVGSVTGHEVVVLRDTVVPLVDLAGALALQGPATSPGDADRRQTGRADEDVTLCVVRSGGSDVGLVVDRFHENVDVILKPLDGVLRGLRCYAGTALLGDGDVLLVLNVGEVVRHAAAA